jgi:1,4-alpha-glucan branching enzyme
MDMEEKKLETNTEQNLPVQELPSDIPAEVRQKLAEDLNEEATEDLKQDMREAEREEANDEEVKANPEMLTKSRLLKLLIKKQYHYDTVRFWVEQFDIDGIRLDAADVLDFDFMRGLQGLCHDTRLYLFSDNHDVERLPNKLRNREHIRHIAILVYSLWGIPSIYYGSEFGIEGKKEWGSDWPLRPCLELSDYADAERTNPVTSVYKALGKCKAELPEMTYGEVKELQLTTQCYAFARVLDGKAVVAVLNNGDTPAQLEFQLPVETAKVTDLLADTVGAQEVLVSTEWNRMKVQLPSNYATILRLKK